VSDFVAAVPVVGLVLWLPGLLLGWALRPAAGLVRNVAVAPAVSFGLLMAIALAVDATGLSVRWWSVLVPALVVAAAACAVRIRRGVGPKGTAIRLGPVEVVVLALVLLGALAVWAHASHWGVAVPPNDDGTHHGLFTARILRLGTLDPGKVGVGDVLSDQPAVGYYPFGLHLVAALVAAIAGIRVATAVDAVAIATAAIVLPLGVFVLTRRVFPTLRHAATAAAVFAVVFPAFPYYVAYWGGLTMIAGVAMIPAVVDAAVGARDDGPWWSAGALFGAAFLGLFEVHNTEVVPVVIVVAVLMLLPWGVGWWERLLAAVPAWLAGAGVFLVVALPQAPTLAANASSRVVAAPLRPLSSGDAWGNAATTFVGFGSVSRGALAVLVLVGVVAAVRLRAAGWIVGAAVFVVLTFASARRYSWADTLTAAWYTRWDRVVIDEVFFLAAFAGAGVVVTIAGLHALTRRITPSRIALVGACTVVIALVVSLALVPQWRGDRAKLRLAFSGASNVDAGQRAAFRFLGTHVARGDRVLNDITQDSGWMYAEDDVSPLFAMAVHAFPPADWGLRVYLMRNAAHLATNPRLAQVADHWRVEWAYVSSQLFPLRTTLLKVNPLLHSPAWRLVFHSGTAWVFERVHVTEPPA
jgi:hypothetical protein